MKFSAITWTFYALTAQPFGVLFGFVVALLKVLMRWQKKDFNTQKLWLSFFEKSPFWSSDFSSFYRIIIIC